jgi:TrmH family RNA methyltransferase
VQQCRALARGGDATRVLLDGEHLIADAMASGVVIETLLASAIDTPLGREAERSGAAVHEASADVLDAASPVRSPSPMVAIARWAPAALDEVMCGASDPAPPLVVALIDVQDPGNVGAAIRSADALGATGVLCLGATANPGSWKALRGAMGSTFRLPVARGRIDAALAAARDRGWRIVATAIDGPDALDRAPLTGPSMILAGNEGAGLPAGLASRADLRVRVSMRPHVNSLNVAVATALVLYEAARQRAAIAAADSVSPLR